MAKGVPLGVQSVMGTSILFPDFDLLDVGDVITVYKNGEPVMDTPHIGKSSTQRR